MMSLSIAGRGDGGPGGDRESATAAALPTSIWDLAAAAAATSANNSNNNSDATTTTSQQRGNSNSVEDGNSSDSLFKYTANSVSILTPDRMTHKTATATDSSGMSKHTNGTTELEEGKDMRNGINYSNDNNSNNNDEYSVVESPVPLNRDEQESAEVRALAAKLAPVLFQADEMLAKELFGATSMMTNPGSLYGHNRTYNSNNNHNDYDDYDDDDDDMDDEVHNLEQSEMLLRQEMENAFFLGGASATGTRKQRINSNGDDTNSLLFDASWNNNKMFVGEGDDSSCSQHTGGGGEIDDYWIQREKSHSTKLNMSTSGNSTLGNTYLETTATSNANATATTTSTSTINHVKHYITGSATSEQHVISLNIIPELVDEKQTLPSSSTSSSKNSIMINSDNFRRTNSSGLTESTTSTAAAKIGGEGPQTTTFPTRIKPAESVATKTKMTATVPVNGFNTPPRPKSTSTTTNRRHQQPLQLLDTVDDHNDIMASMNRMIVLTKNTPQGIKTKNSTTPAAVTATSSLSTPLNGVNKSVVYTIRDHLHALQLFTEYDDAVIGGGSWYTVDMTRYFLKPSVSASPDFVSNDIDDSNNDIGSSDDADKDQFRGIPTASDPASTTIAVGPEDVHNNDNNAVNKQESQPQTPQTSQSPNSTDPIRIMPTIVKEYCLSMPESNLRRMYIGLRDGLGLPLRKQQDVLHPSSVNSIAQNSPSSPTLSMSLVTTLPIRTIAIRIRPDVLCGVVMEAVAFALMNHVPAKIHKRQGGHCQASVHGEERPLGWNFGLHSNDDDDEVVDDDRYDRNSMDSNTNNNINNPVTEYYRPFFVDIQLTTYKSEQCERMLLIRIYHSNTVIASDGDDDIIEEGDEASRNKSIEHHDVDQESRTSTSPKHSTCSDDPASLHLRECSSIIQRIEAPEYSKRIRLNHDQSLEEVKKVVTKHLLNNYRPCPSVQNSNLTLPSLNPDDYGIIKSSWRLVQSIWDELDSRDLTYSSLAISRFGSFPSLPTLDVHYCSQIRKICRDGMIVQLLKGASELEEYAREAELACANMISLLRPVYERYNIREPPLPKPAKTLSEYPLEYIMPQEACPPWGDKVQMALSRVQEMTSNANQKVGNDSVQLFSPTMFDPTNPSGSPAVHSSTDMQKSLDMASQAVSMVLDAFHKQDDEEQAARLGRKNIQVMDRLANMQKHEKFMIQILEQAGSYSDVARNAAIEFRMDANGGNNGIQQQEEVPLLKWRVNVGNSSGICTVTAHSVLFVTQYIPIIGPYKRTLFKLQDIEFKLEEIKNNPSSTPKSTPTATATSTATSSSSPSSLLLFGASSAGSITIIQDDHDVFQFKPVSVDHTRIKSFLDVVQAMTLIHPVDVITEYYAEDELV